MSPLCLSLFPTSSSICTMQMGCKEHFLTERPVMTPISRIFLNTASLVKRRVSVQSSMKATESELGNSLQTASKSKHIQQPTFPMGLEALVLDVCDETNIAELKVKVGDFEMHLKRDVGSTMSSAPSTPSIVSPSTAPPIPSKPMSLHSEEPPPKPSSSPSSPFAYVSSVKESKLASLKASGSSGYVLVSSPTVGTFRSGRTVKGKKQPPSCKEGAVIKEGQVIGYLDQFGNELPIKSTVTGEVLKILFRDGEPVGYGDPLVAVLPSFHGIELS